MPSQSLHQFAERTERRFQKVICVMPAYNAEQTLEKTYRSIPAGCIDEFILTDDGSRDSTVDIA
ncbi:MAG: glycosyltransferase, partial [Calditrichaeota bacterium]|nr:glycosyltransferase [Calditrichota bacterium]